jgi:hypothetical protein
MSRRTMRNFRPQLDSLERRECPAVDVVQREALLYLTGDAADDWVAVCDEGSQMVEVQTARGSEIYRGVKWVVGNLGEGDDSFEFHQAATNPSNSLVVKVDLAAGGDRFEYRSPPPERDQPPPERDRPTRYLLDIHTGAGDDVMVVGPEYIPGLDLDLQFDLGAGNDTFEASYKRDPAMPVGIIIPCVSLDIQTGEGNDDLRITFGDLANPESMPVAELRTGIRGFGGDTSAIVGYSNLTVTGGVTEAIDLGGGHDSVKSTLSNLSVGGTLKQSVIGGDGEDEVGIIIIGGRFGAATQKVNTGEGDDIVSVWWEKSEVRGPAVTQIALAEDHDLADVTISATQILGAMTLKLDTGSGDDDASVLMNQADFGGPAKVRIALGDGNDEGDLTIGGNTHSLGPMIGTMNTGGGDDSASVMLQDSEDFTAFEGPLTLRVILGTGDDLGNVVVRDANEVAGPLSMVADGGSGDDGIVADVDFTPRVRAAQLDPGNAPVSVLVDLRGGDGLDTVDAYTEGVWHGVARFLLRGGVDADDLGFHGVIGDGSTGTLAVVMDGAAGDDVLGASVSTAPNGNLVPILFRMLGGAGGDVLSLSLLGGPDTTPEPHLFVLDGGDGFDLARVPAGAVVRNCEGRF